MWGTLEIERSHTAKERFIPTRVGNSKSSSYLKMLNSVHPHACGELHRKNVLKATIFGSSPRVWGTHSGCPHRQACRRFIPTRVGNSHHCVRGKCRVAVHPHACGELQLWVFWVGCVGGSSPRVWGTLFIFYTGKRKNFSGNI